jgi:hypothetical protein
MTGETSIEVTISVDFTRDSGADIVPYGSTTAEMPYEDNNVTEFYLGDAKVDEALLVQVFGEEKARQLIDEAVAEGEEK